MSRGSAFNEPLVHRPGGSLVSGSVSKFPGLPVGLSTFSRCKATVFEFEERFSQEALVSNPAAPAVGDGTMWRSTAFASAGTLSFVRNTSPPYFRMATPGVDGQGAQFQCQGGTANNSTVIDLSVLKRAWIEMIVRFSDASNNETTTLQQSEWFIGFQVIDTNIFSTCLDFVGLHKPDASAIVSIAADDDSVASMSAAGHRTAALDLSKFSLDRNGTGAVNEWVKLGVMIDMAGTDQALAYCFAENGAPRNVIQSPHKATAQLGANVPNAAMCPTFGFKTGEAVAKNFDVAMIHYGYEYRLV
jgi:hypothetical protein